jgi:tetratricopeptide (TPR) repeat protein
VDDTGHCKDGNDDFHVRVFCKSQWNNPQFACIFLNEKAKNGYLTNMKGKAQIHRAIQSGSTKTNFEKLVSVVIGMKPEELKTAKNYISFGHQDKFKGAPAMLLDVLIENNQINYEQAIKHLGGISKSAFDTVVIRLKEKLNYCLVSEFNTMRENGYSPRYQAFFQCKDFVKMIHILMRRGATQEAYSKILLVIELSEQFEWYDSLIEASYLLLEYYSLVSEFGTIDEIENKIPFYEYCRKAVIKSKLLYDDLLNTSKKSTEGNSLQLYEKTIEHINELYSKTSSGLVNYQLLKISINYYLQQNNFGEAERKAQELLSHVSNTPSVKQPLTISVALLHIAECLLMQKNYTEALDYIKSARIHLSKGSINYGESLEIEFYCLLYTGQLAEAETVINELLDQKTYAVTRYHKNRRNFMHCCALFAQEKYEQAYDVLIEIGYLTKDKAGWNIGIRLMMMMLAKLNKDSIRSENILAQWQREIATMRKHIAFTKRDLELFKLLKKLSRTEQTWAKFVSAEKNIIDQFRNEELAWKPASHEIINVVDWLQSKARNIQFAEFLKTESMSKPMSVFSS